MKKAVPGLYMLLLTSLLIAAKASMTVKAGPRTWTVNVDGPADFHTVHEAINAASEEDTILVFPGIYNESLTVGKSIVLKGESAQTTIVQGSGDFAVVQVSANGVTMANFTIRNGTIGLLIDSSNNNRILGNIIAANNDGIWTPFSSGNTISDNTVVNNTVGLFLDSSNNTLVSHNTIVNNTYGIDMENCRSIAIKDNKVASSRSEGIFAYRSSNGTISGNTLQDNPLAIHLDNSNSNNIYQNNFINNSRQVHTMNSDNTWDNGSNGNYWSDYSGTDANQDGIGDTPYIIDPNNRDRYPLMTPSIKPRLVTDINRDGKVNILDIGLVARAFGSKPKDPRWNSDADIDGNGIINIIDVTRVAKDFGKNRVDTGLSIN